MKRTFQCSVGCKHTIEIGRDENDEGTEWEDCVNAAIDINVWSLAHLMPLLERMKNAWRMICGKETIYDGICLMPSEAQEMARFLLALSSAAHPADTAQASVGDATYSCSCSTFATPSKFFIRGKGQPKPFVEMEE